MKQAALLNKVANSIHSQIRMYYYSSSFTRVKKRKTPKKTPQIAKRKAHDSKKQPQNIHYIGSKTQERKPSFQLTTN